VEELDLAVMVPIDREPARLIRRQQWPGCYQFTLECSLTNNDDVVPLTPAVIAAVKQSAYLGRRSFNQQVAYTLLATIGNFSAEEIADLCRSTELAGIEIAKSVRIPANISPTLRTLADYAGVSQNQLTNVLLIHGTSLEAEDAESHLVNQLASALPDFIIERLLEDAAKSGSSPLDLVAKLVATKYA
tara:strand:- start:34057 stop:34620 length:564 start_codon:yes stop_codon:yes gene_type:complete